MNSLKSLAPIGTMRNGASEPISAALATLLFVAPAKKMARFRPKNAPGTSAWRTCRIVTRRPVLQRYTLNTTVATVSRQNATSTPGVSARLASVELSEKPMTTPATASAPSVFAPNTRVRFSRAASVSTAVTARIVSSTARPLQHHRKAQELESRAFADEPYRTRDVSRLHVQLAV